MITKADKECKLVALNNEDYLNGLHIVLSYSTKFSKYVDPPRKRGRASSMNIFEKKKKIADFVKFVPNLNGNVNCKRPTRQPNLYGLAETHENKTPVPLRPVLSTTNSLSPNSSVVLSVHFVTVEIV